MTFFLINTFQFNEKHDFYLSLFTPNISMKLINI